MTLKKDGAVNQQPTPGAVALDPMEPAAPAIQSVNDCAIAIASIGEADRALDAIQADLDKRVAELKAEAEAKAAPLIKLRESLEDDVHDYCDRHRAELTGNHVRKFAEFTTGKVGWRKCGDKLVVDEARVEKIIVALKRKKLRRMLRFTTTLDAAAIKKEPDKIRGIRGLKIETGEERFWVEPVALPLAEPAPVA